MLRCVLGDETGTVNALLPDEGCIIAEESLVLFNAEARVTAGHIELVLGLHGRVEASRGRRVTQVKTEVDISAAEWELAN